MLALESCAPDEIVDFAGRIYTLGEVVYEAVAAPFRNRALFSVSRDDGLSPLKASHLMILAGRQDFQAYMADIAG